MTVYFQGSEHEALWPNPGFGTSGENTASDATWARVGASMSTGDENHWILADPGTNVNPFWAHDEVYNVNNNSVVASGRLSWIADDANVPIIRCYFESGLGKFQYWNGAAWVTVTGGEFGWDGGTFSNGSWDMHLRIGDGVSVPDVMELYHKEILLASKSAVNFLYANFPDGGRYYYRRSQGNVQYAFSQVVIADEVTLDWNSKTIVPTTDGTDSTDGTGVVGDVNEAGINNGTFIAFTAAGQRRSFKAPARTLANAVKAFTVAGRLRLAEDTTPNKAKPYVRPAGSGTRYYGTTFTLTVGYKNYEYTWNTNPATGEPWTTSEVNHADLEFGWEIVA